MEAVDLAHVKKYVERGWSTPETIILPYDVGGVKSKSLFSNGPRWVGDSKTWKMRLDTRGVEPPAIPDYVLENDHFNITIGLNVDHYGIVALLIRSSVLKYQYTYGYGKRWFGFLRSKLDPLTTEELKKVNDRDLLPFIRQHASHDSPEIMDLDKPVEWKYYDHMITEWHKEWLKIIFKRATS